MDKGRVIRLVLIPVMLGLVVTLVIRQVLSRSEAPTSAAPMEMTSVVAVASSQPIAARTRLSEVQLTMKQLPKAALTGTEFTDIKEVAGQVTLVELFPGEVILPNRLVPDGKGALPFRIPSGRRAVTIRIDELNGVAGYPEPGDLVDLVLTLPARPPERPLASSRILYEQVLVLGKGPAPNSGGAAPSAAETTAKSESVNAPARITSLTVALEPEAAVEVALAEQLGVIKVMLRPALKEGDTGRIVTSEALYK